MFPFSDRRALPYDFSGGLIGGLKRRLPWILVFRGLVATGLLLITLLADVLNWHVRLLAVVLYGVVIGTYCLVFVLGLLLRTRTSPVIISTVHLSTAVMAALMVVQATGGVESGFSFLYLLAVLDGAIVGGRFVALVVATAASIGFGGQIALQLHGIFSAGLLNTPPDEHFFSAVLTHIGAFYVVALLAGHLAQLLESARQAASHAQTELHNAQAFHARILEALPVGVMTILPSGEVLSANTAVSKILNRPLAELLGSPCPIQYAAGQSSSQSNSSEITDNLSDKPVHLLVQHSKAKISAEDLAQNEIDIVVVEDQTERHALAEALKVKEKLASIGTISAAIAHEIRNPLAAISGSLELLHDPKLDTSKRDRLEKIVSREVARLERLVADFLTYARPNTPSFAQTELVRLIKEVGESLTIAGTFATANIAIESPKKLEAEVDANQFRQVFWNLLRNAAEASPPNSPIEVSLRQTGNSQNSIIEIEIRDHGEGLKPEIQARLFEPFNTAKASGTGLGLAVVKRIIETHAGTIELVPHELGGTRAVLKLPAKQKSL